MSESYGKGNTCTANHLMTIDGDEEEECTAIPFIKFIPEDGKVV